MATPDARPSVAIVGGGWAGLACALQLARAGFKPIVFESAPEAGGRARRARLGDTWRDNGQHLMLRGCRALTQLFDDVGLSMPRVPFAYTDDTRVLSLAGRRGRSGLLLALLNARGWRWTERAGLLRALLHLQFHGWRVDADLTVAQWLEDRRQPLSLVTTFWAPLALAILNTPLEQAAMTRLAPVLRDTLGAGGAALSVMQPHGNLSSSVVAAWVDAVLAAGGAVRCASRVTEITHQADALQLHYHAADASAVQSFDHVVLTVPPWALSHIALPFESSGLTERFGAQPIATVYLGFDPETTGPLTTPLIQLAGPTPEDARVWAMDRTHCGEPGVITISLSAEGPWASLDHEALAQACLHHLRTATDLQAPCLWHKVVTVQRATPCATPAARLHPHERQPLPGLYLAGDWTHDTYPATLEAAVQTGFDAATRVMTQIS